MGQPPVPSSWPSPDQPTPAHWQQPEPTPQVWQQVDLQQAASVPPAPAPTAWGDPSGNPVPPVPQMPAPAGYQPPAGQSMYGVRQPQQQPAPQQGSYGQFTFPVAPKQKLEPLAVAGVATSPLGPVGIVLGLLARGRVKQNRRRSMRLAWTGVALGAVFTVGWVLAVAMLSMNGTIDRALERPQQGDVEQARTIAAANLAVGNCISTLPPAQQVGEIRLVPCAQEHIAQVVTLHELSGEFPGAPQLSDQATQTCATDVGEVDAGDASFVPWFLVPSEAGWAQGNTQVVCLLRGDAGPLQVDLVNS